MKKITMLGLLLVAGMLGGCSNTKIVNGREQTFTEYVILNKYAEEKELKEIKEEWEYQTSESFPILRWIKWSNI